MKNSTFFLLLISSFISLIQWNCSHTKSLEKIEQHSNVGSKDSILFLFLRIEKNPVDKKVAISYNQHTLVPGTLKTDNDLEISYSHRLLVEFWADKEKLKSFAIDHPLYKELEYNSGSEFKRKTIELDSDQFFIRTSWNIRLTECRIFEIIGSKKPQKLTSINLKKL